MIMLSGVARRLCKPMIEGTEAGTGYVGNDSIEDLAATLIRIEIPVD